MTKGLKDVTVIPVKHRKKVVTPPEEYQETIHRLIVYGFPNPRPIWEAFVKKAS